TVISKASLAVSFTRNKRDESAHKRDIRIIRTNITLDNRIACAEYSPADQLPQLIRQLFAVPHFNLDELFAAKISPVPVGRRHLLQRLLVKPRPDAVRIVLGILILQRNDFADYI